MANMLIVMTVLFLIGLIFGILFVYAIQSNSLYTIAKVIVVIVFSMTIAANTLLYVMVMDPKMLMTIWYPISMSVGMFLGLLYFVVFAIQKK